MIPQKTKVLGSFVGQKKTRLTTTNQVTRTFGTEVTVVVPIPIQLPKLA